MRRMLVNVTDNNLFEVYVKAFKVTGIELEEKSNDLTRPNTPTQECDQEGYITVNG